MPRKIAPPRNALGRWMAQKKLNDSAVADMVGVTKAMICNLRCIETAKPSLCLANRLAIVSEGGVPASDWGVGDWEWQQASK